MLDPFIPSATTSIFKKLGTPARSITSLSGGFDNLKPGTKVTVGDILFTKIEIDKECEELTTAGSAVTVVSDNRSGETKSRE